MNGAEFVRYLILSDIHANIDALDAVMATAPAHDAVWNLGDLVGYGAAPNEVIERVVAMGHVFVRGNHDRVCAGMRSGDDFNPVAQKSAAWTQETLTRDHADWLSQLAKGPVHPNGPQVSCAHGSPLDEDQYVSNVREAWLPLRRAERPINFFGHTHIQCAFATNGGSWFEIRPDYTTKNEFETWEFALEPALRYLINPGAVGQPRDGDWRAAAALYDDAAMTIRFLRVPYDVARAQQRIYDASLPDRLAKRLADGR
jgi:diadenosine tetraphosphatase ApaH/serine/threonine PP2A family protein phosphatase